MKRSLLGRFATAAFVVFGLGIVTAGYATWKLWSFQTELRSMRGSDSKHVAEAERLALRLDALSVLSPLDASFDAKLGQATEELTDLSRNLPEASAAAEDLKKFKNGLTFRSAELHLALRDVKVSAFALYRSAWNNKWMSVAQTLGSILDDLNGISENDAKKAVVRIPGKIESISQVVSRSSLPQATKLVILKQFTEIQGFAERYLSLCAKAEETKENFTKMVTASAAALKGFLEERRKSVNQVESTFYSHGIRAWISLFLFALLGCAWIFTCMSKLSKQVRGVSQHFTSQLEKWISAGGMPALQEFKEPEQPNYLDQELAPIYAAVDKTIRKINVLRKEDLYLKRLLNVPCLLVNSSKQAVFWNSALCVLAHSRTVEDLGATAYGNVLKLLNDKNEAIDVIGQCFTSGEEIKREALVPAGEGSTSVEVVCTPVLASDRSVDYVVVHIRDLTSEVNRIVRALNTQTNILMDRISTLEKGAIPEGPTEAERRIVASVIVKAMEKLRKIGLDRKEKNAIINAQVNTLWQRLNKESELKENVLKRIEGIQSQVHGVNTCLKELRSVSSRVRETVAAVKKREEDVIRAGSEVRHRSDNLVSGLKANFNIIQSLLKKLTGYHEFVKSLNLQGAEITALIQDANALATNTAIRASKERLTSEDILALNDSFADIVALFEESSSAIRRTVTSVEEQLGTMQGEFEGHLKNCLNIKNEDKLLLKSIRQTEGMVEAERQMLEGVLKTIERIQSDATQVAGELENIETNTARLTQIGQASLSLQTELKKSVENILKLES